MSRTLGDRLFGLAVLIFVVAVIFLFGYLLLQPHKAAWEAEQKMELGGNR
ncbi:MAG: hypothetical protein ACYSUK_00190 [Planctomycetota bacterium]